MSIWCSTLEGHIKTVKNYHGDEAPGVAIGGFMVDMALRSFPDGVLYDAVCETRSCLPDSVPTSCMPRRSETSSVLKTLITTHFLFNGIEDFPRILYLPVIAAGRLVE